MATPILTTKLQVPPLRRNLVSRERLLACLEKSLAPDLPRKLTVVSAPAGFGKTTLLGEWVHNLQKDGGAAVEVAWLSLDAGDNDPARFAAYLSAALDLATAGAAPRDTTGGRGEQPGDEVSEPAGSFLQEAYLTGLINRLAAIPRAIVLVLDDYHLITSAKIHDAVAFVVDHLPDNLHLVLATRADPPLPLPLPRLRARGQLTEMRQGDLRFTTEEAADFLNRVMGLDLSAQDVAALEARTEGWIAGLQMASLALQGQPLRGGEQSSAAAARAQFIRAFTGSHRFVLDYLTEEVLQRQPEEVKVFLLCTSVLERMCAPLCDTLLEAWKEAAPRAAGRREDGKSQASVLAGPDSADLLSDLERANLFVIPLDHERRWYRYHRLFADLLRSRVRQSAPELVPELHRRASTWYEQEGLVAEAIEHALAADDVERAAALVEVAVETTFMRSEVVTFLSWVERLPDKEVRARPMLSLYHVWALLMSGRSIGDLDARLEDLAGLEAPSLPQGAMAARVAALRAYYSVFQLDMAQAVDFSHYALEHLPESDAFLRSSMAWILSMARLADASIQDGKEALGELARSSKQAGNRLIEVTALCHRAKLQTRQGRLHDAYRTYERALEVATDRLGQRLPIAGEALIGLGELEHEWNHLDVAEDALGQGIHLANQWSELAAFDAYTPLMRVRLAQGDVQGAREAVEAARRIAERSEATRIDDVVVELQQALLCVAEGDTAGATQWVHRLAPVADPAGGQVGPGVSEDLASARLRKYVQLVLARLFVFLGDTARAVDLLDRLLAHARMLERIDLSIEIQILRAVALKEQEMHDEALEACGDALSLAEPGGHVRTFVDEGERLRALISEFGRWIAARGDRVEAQERTRLLQYVSTLLAAFPEPAGPGPAATSIPPQGGQQLVEPLSDRELEVLRLLATGMSNPEIADELVVAVSTVRTHCKNIYSKLEVHSRWDAAERAHELGLISRSNPQSQI